MEVRQPGLIGIGAIRIDRAQAGGELGRKQPDVARVSVDVRIAAGMDVAVAAVDDRGTFQDLHVFGRHQVPRLPRLDAESRPPLHQDREPADLKLGPGAEQEVRAADLGD